jgi:hypothetical protein
MGAQPPRGTSDLRFPFHVTQSEARIMRELLAIVALRGDEAAEWQNEDFLTSRSITTAAGCIEALREDLFPEETKLRKKRAEFLKPLNGSPMRAHFDQSLETATLTLHAQVQSKLDYENLLKRLQAFNFDEWQAHCDRERIDAD